MICIAKQSSFKFVKCCIGQKAGLSHGQRMDALYGNWSKLIGGISAQLSRFYATTMGHQQQHYTVAVEGNIGSGKTFLLSHFENCPHAEVLTEPVAMWRNIEGHNALGLMYQDPTRWSMTLQTYVQLTMLQQHTKPKLKPVKLMERSIHSAKYCFAENLYKSGKMPEIEYVVLTKWFDWLMHNQDMHLDLIVYLRTDPKTVHERIKQRCRVEETAIPLDYLQALHDLHEDWLYHKTKFTLPAPVLVLDANKGKVEMIETYEKHSSEILCGHS